MAPPDLNRRESPQPAKQENQPHLVEITPEQKAKLVSALPKMREDLNAFKVNYKIFEETHKDFFDKHAKGRRIGTLLDTIEVHMTELDDLMGRAAKGEYLKQAIDVYNLHVYELNRLVSQFDREAQETRSEKLMKAIRGELPMDSSQFSEADRKEFQEFAKALWEELFPQSYVEKYFLLVTGSRKPAQMEWFEKILLAPASGVEAAITGLANLANPKSTEEFDTAVNISWDNRKQMAAIYRCLKFAHNNMSTSTEIATVLSFIYSMAFLFRGAKVLKASATLKAGPKVKALIDTMLAARSLTYLGGKLGKTLPAGIMIGLSLKQIDTFKKL